MSLFSTLRTSVSGMAAQSNALSAIGDNIANSSTTGYKEANAQFETLLGNNSTSSYESGGVLTDIRYGITDQGTLQTTTSATDLAINGNGFFVVSNGGGQGQFLTRAGSFVPDSNGNLVNTAGMSLMGYAVNGQNTSPTLSVVNMSATALQAQATSSGVISANMPSTATAAATGTTPGDVGTTSSNVNYTDKTSMTVYDNLGQADVVDVYFTKTSADTWQVQAYNHADASPNGGFPYAKSIGSTSLTYGSTTGAYASGSPMSIAIPNGNSALSIDLSSTTQLAANFSVAKSQANDGNAPSNLSSVKIGTDGTLTAVYANGAQIATYKIPLAIVPSPDNLTPLNGNVYQTSQTSGAAVLTSAASGGAGSILSDSLEQSTVDLATELTSMVVAQRGYEANSKVLQAASDLLSTLNHLQTN